MLVSKPKIEPGEKLSAVTRSNFKLCMEFAILLSGGFGGRAGQTAGLLGSKDVLDLKDGESIIVLRVRELLKSGFGRVVLVARKGRAVRRYQEIFKEIDPEYLSYLEDSGSMYKVSLAKRLREIQGYPVDIVEQDPELPYGNFSPLYTLYQKGMFEPGYSYLVAYADDDVLGENPSAQLVQEYKNGSADIMMMAQEVSKEEVSKFGTFDFGDHEAECSHTAKGNRFLQGRVKRLAEKASAEHAPSHIASLGRMILPYDIFNYALRAGYQPNGPKSAKDPGFREFNTVDAINAMADDGYSVLALGVAGRWLTTGDVPSLNFARFVYAIQEPDQKERFVQYLMQAPDLRGYVAETLAHSIPSRQ